MKVLVSGAGGFLGTHVVERLLERGHAVRAIVRPASVEPAWTGNVEIVRADLRVTDDLVALFRGMDAVIHLAAATSGGEDSQFASSVVGTERFLDAMAQSQVTRFIHVSSLAVYDWERTFRTMDEKSPLLTDVYEAGAYTIAKVWQERIISRCARQHSWDLTILRPGFIWGKQHAEIAGMGRHFGRCYLMFGPLTRLPLSHVVNCADCIVAALESPSSSGEIFNVIDQDDVTVWRYVKEYARRSRQGGFFIPVPYFVGLLTAYAALCVSRLLFGRKGKLPSLLTPRRYEAQFKPLRFSNQKLKQALNWVPRLNFDQCLNSTYH